MVSERTDNRRKWKPLRLRQPFRSMDEHPYWLAVLVGASAGALVFWRCHCDAEAIDFYGKNVRGSMFSGFLSLGAFLLSLKTFILVKMKEGLYDQASYKERHTQSVVAGGDREMYAPIFALRGFLLWSIVCALLTAVLQMTVGLVANAATVAVCVAFGAATLTLLFRSLIEINRNLRSWFSHAEELRQEELQRNPATKQ